MKVLSNDVKGIGTMTIAIFAVIVIIVAAAGIYVLTKNNDSEDTDNSDDNALTEYYSVDIDEANVLGSMGIGTVLTYKVISGNDNGLPISKEPIIAVLSGQSGSYYFFALHTDLFSLQGIPFMLDKATGEMRGGTFVGTDSINYGGKTVSLDVYSNNLPGKDLSICSADGIPYRITVEAEYTLPDGKAANGNFIIDLASFDATPATPYVAPERFGESLYYSFENQDGSSGVVSICAVGNHTNPNGERLLFIMYFHLEDKNGVRTEACRYAQFGMNDAVKFIEFDDVSGEESIQTIDGEVACDVVEFFGDKMYVGKETGIAYLYEFADFINVVHGELKLFKYVL